jgi:AraC family transcriptional regulator, transcriptional activator of pobA
MQLLNITQATQKYSHFLDKENSRFGMDVLANDFNPEQIAIVQNQGTKTSCVPIRFDFYIIILCLNGGSIRNVNQHKYEIKEHSLQLIPKGAIHSFEDTVDNPKFYIILFEKEIVDEVDILNFHDENFDNVTLDLNTFNKIRDIYEEIDVEMKNKNKNYIEYVTQLLCQILIILKREKLKVKTNLNKTRADLICNQFLSLIELHFTTKKSVQEYAELMDLTPKHLSETVKEKLGESALFFIHERIMKEAKYLLVYSNKTIYNIAIELTFYDASQFTRFFKQKIGLTPNNYRNIYKN